MPIKIRRTLLPLRRPQDNNFSALVRANRKDIMCPSLFCIIKIGNAFIYLSQRSSVFPMQESESQNLNFSVAMYV